ncbi:CMP-N-acetylneuraminate-beta-galactosamide-alpha-2,3-sialyltransferase 1-like isoform X1 [Mobula birostris]|uniref:CMP-N-acetylneuraminate-beta-galactosamide- alpha-2,3-sialyltransferase 1-like isoform X1 n=1 Tax=Mobula birostris TaxID=1983395 RepID=UPI003B27FF81
MWMRFPVALCCFRMSLSRWAGILFLLLCLFTVFWCHRKEARLCRKNSCGCETCIAEQRVSLWFDKRFNSTVQPLLTSDNQDIPHDILLWWLKLQLRKPALALAHHQLFQRGIKSKPVLRMNPCRCQTCAVVGNSGNLNGSNYGKLIDSHGFVFRMNKAKTQGYETDVGSKTTHHLMYPESARSLEPHVHLVLVPFKPQDLQWLENAPWSQKLIHVNWNKAAILHPGFLHYVHELWTEGHGRYPSTGLLALVLGLHLCDQLSVFGYGMDARGNWHHYWEKNRQAGAFHFTGVHDAIFESGVIWQLARVGKVQLYRGRP